MGNATLMPIVIAGNGQGLIITCVPASSCSCTFGSANPHRKLMTGTLLVSFTGVKLNKQKRGGI